jgi:hypothetical protein
MEDDRVPWVAKIRSIYEQYDHDVPQYRRGEWKNVFKSQTAHNNFNIPLIHENFSSMQPIEDKQMIWDRVLSKSYISTLEASDKKALKAEIMNVLDNADLEHNEHGQILYPYQTDFYYCIKRIL